MKERELNERESLTLIAEMIRDTKVRLHIGDGNMMLIWGYAAVISAILVNATYILTGDPRCNILWMLIPVIGLPLKRKELKRLEKVSAPKTYTDRISEGIWKIVALLAVISTTMCCIFMLTGHNCWKLMFIYAFIAVGFGIAFQGIVIREKSLVAGGLFSITAGGIFTCCLISGIQLTIFWISILYISSITAMTIIPGHIINHKARHICIEN